MTWQLNMLEARVLIDVDFLRNPKLSGNEKMIYLLLKSYCPPNVTECSPSIRASLTVDTGLSARCIISTLRSLEEKGFIDIVTRSGTSPNIYIIK